MCTGFWLALPVACAHAASGAAVAQGLPPPGWKISDVCAKAPAPGQCAAFQCAAVEGTALKSISATWPLLLDQTKHGCSKQLSHVADQCGRELAACVNDAGFKVADGVAVKTARTSPEPVPPPRVAPSAIASDLLPPSPSAPPPAPQSGSK